MAKQGCVGRRLGRGVDVARRHAKLYECVVHPHIQATEMRSLRTSTGIRAVVADYILSYTYDSNT